MSSWIASKATALAPYATSFAKAIENELPGLGAIPYSCKWGSAGGSCSLDVVAQQCSQDPYAMFAASAIANLVNYFDEALRTFNLVIDRMTPAFASFPGTFMPNNVTKFPASGPSDEAIAGTALYFAGSLAGLIPGVGPVLGGAFRVGGLGANLGEFEEHRTKHVFHLARQSRHKDQFRY